MAGKRKMEPTQNDALDRSLADRVDKEGQRGDSANTGHWRPWQTFCFGMSAHGNFQMAKVDFPCLCRLSLLGGLAFGP